MRIYVETYGCQMNEYDSKMIRSMLEASGHTPVGGPSNADVVIVNTCSVRERAEKRVLGRLGQLRGLMEHDAVLGVIGCVAQRLGDRLMRSARGVQFVVGTDRYDRLPEIIAEAKHGRRTIDTGVDPAQSYGETPEPTRASLTEFVSVMRGCDNFCSYCVVPYVRGRERSRRADEIVEETRALVRLGTRDVTLIGQNVDSYRDGSTDFAGLLERVHGIAGLDRIRFATSHPKDLSARLVECVATLDRVCEHIHLPVQAGSDRILDAMNRSYGRSEYLDLVGRIRDAVPGVALTTDVIVGFPGEADDDFASTLSLMEEVRFDSAFMFRYSVREGTRAAELPDDVPDETKIARLERVIALQRRITEEINGSLVGSVEEVLVEGPSENCPARLFGKTRTAKAVVLPGGPKLKGTLIPVEITAATAWTLHGSVAP